MSDNVRGRQPRIRFGSTSDSEKILIPLRLAIVADLAPDGSPLRRGVGTPLHVDKDSFNDALQEICPRVVFNIQDRNSPGNAFHKIEFAVEDLKSFHPSHLLKAVEVLRQGFDAREALGDLRERKINLEQLLERLKSSSLPFLSGEALSKIMSGSGAASPAPAHAQSPATSLTIDPGKEGMLDSILDLVEPPAEAKKEPIGGTAGAARVQQLISEMFATTGSRAPVDRRVLDECISECDAALSDQMNDVLFHEEFRRLESAWRSLRFFVERTDFRESIQLEIIPSSKEHLPQVLRSLLEQSENSEVPLAAVITDFEFDASSPEMECLKAAAEFAEQLQAPLLVNMGAAFFGKRDAVEVSRIPLLRTHLESAGFVKWAAFREAESSRWAAAGFNRFLLRKPYDALFSGNKIPFHFEERGVGVWGNASWAIGCLLTRSFAQSKWCGHLTGIRGGGALEDLPVHAHQLPSGEVTQIPLETIFLKDREDDFYVAGFMAFQCGENQDKAAILRAPLIHRPEIYSELQETEDSRWRATLTYQMVATRMVHHLGPVLQRLVPLGSPSEIERGVEQDLRAFIGQSGAAVPGAVEVRLQDSEAKPGFYDLRIHIRPGPAIWSLSTSLDLRISIRKG